MNPLPPMQRRGFIEHVGLSLGSMGLMGLDEVDVLTLKQAGLVGQIAKVVKVINTGAITKSVKLTGIGATAGAKAAIEAAGGSIA